MSAKSLNETDFSLLYKIALSSGRSVHTIENCAIFLSVLIEQINLSFASVWVYDSFRYMDQERKGVSLIGGYPKQKIQDVNIDISHPICQKLEFNEIVRIDSKDSNFIHYVNEKEIKKGVIGIYKLNKIGFLKIFKETGSLFCLEDLKALKSVIDNFAISLEGNFAYERVKNTQLALVKAKQTAEHAQLAEQQFLATMSHEIRTPLNSVVGMTDLLLDTEVNEEQQEYLSALKFSTENLMVIINDILDISKIEANELGFESKPFNIKEVFDSIVNTFKYKMNDLKNVKFEYSIDSDINYALIGDRTRLSQILINLLNNATKFTSKGFVRFRVNHEKVKENQYCLIFSISDSGIGIEKDKIKMIFKKFKQASPEIVRNFGGTGLGLSIVKKLVELQNGSVKVQSVKGKGSTFTVTLPYQTRSVVSYVDNNNVKLDQSILRLVRGLNILVAEDNIMNLKLITKIFNKWKIDIDIAHDGNEVVEMSKYFKYDVILMDVHMPKYDGYEATRMIQEDSNNINNNTPIIALTASVLMDERKKAISAGMCDFLEKPFSANILLQTLSKIAHN